MTHSHFPAAARPASPTSIHDLPIEILTAIIEQTTTIDETYDDLVDPFVNTLHCCSLVSTTWSSIASPLLWRSVAPGNSWYLRRVVSSPALGKYPTIELELTRSVEEDNKLALQVIYAVKGVRRLALNGFNFRLGDRVWMAPGLSGMESLVLWDTVLHPYPSLSNPSFHYSPTKLSIQLDNFLKIPETFQDHISMPFPNLTDLTLSVFDTDSLSYFEALLHFSIPKLERFSWDGDTLPTFMPLFTQANHLISLTILVYRKTTSASFAIFPLLPTSLLKTIYLDLGIFWSEPQMRDATKTMQEVKDALNLPQLSRLEMIVVRYASREMDTVQWWKELKESFQGRGVKVVQEQR